MGTPRDAGTQAVDHYASKMVPWRFYLRSLLLASVRKETEVLARMQKSVRGPWLDTYFAWSANLGSHTFYMVMLPVFFWSGNAKLGDDVVWVLALGVYLGGVLKDFFCLPRPLSPPLHRISMSGSAVLEYGFPSTHSCNAISVALVLAASYPHWITHVFNCSLILTLVAGRVYNGMHGFIDVISGCLLGVVCYYIRDLSSPSTTDAGVTASLLFTAMALIAIYVCPEPVDDCPCFDDSVAFTGVLLGICWCSINDHTRMASDPLPAGIQKVGYILLRAALGVPSVIIWRTMAKRTLLRALPPIWRVIGKLGLQHDRRYFLPASEYTKLSADDVLDESVPDNPAQISQMIRRVRRAHGRSDSVGPQSAADVYEALANKREGSSEPEPELIKIPKPRVRYDVEVVMRLIVYAGIPLVGGPVMANLYRAIGI